MTPFLRSRSPFRPSPAGAFLSYLALVGWTIVVLFPLYWLAVTSLKIPLDVNRGPLYVPYVDFQPSLHAWRYIFVDLGGYVFRPYANTIVVALMSSTITLLLGASAAYGLSRFAYRPRLAAIFTFILCVALVAAASRMGMDWRLGALAAAVLYAIFLQTVVRRFHRGLENRDIAVWMISTRILPPLVVVIPLYVYLQRLGLLDTRLALVVSYVAINLPIVVWLMRDYFLTCPVELEECAAIDGASRFRIFWSVVLPLAVPGLVATYLLVLVFTWNEYLLALFLSRANAQTMPLLVAAMNGTRGTEWWYMSVVILIMIVPVIVMAVALERFIARGILIGAIKG